MTLKIAHVALAALMIIILILFAKKTIDRTFLDKNVRKRKLLLVAGGLLAWHVYLYLMSISGILDTLSLPPRFAIFLIVPAFIFTGIFLFKNRNNAWIQNVPESWLIFYQSFRILVESLFVASVAEGILHKNVTIEGYNYDMVFGFLAVVIGFLFIRKMISKKMIVLWNYLGLLVIAFIIFLFTTTIYTPEIFGPDTLPFPQEFLQYPYTLVAGFLMPSAVFMHVLSIFHYKDK